MITIVGIEDWEGIYKDGKLLLEDHRLHLEDVFRVLDIEHESFWVESWDDNWSGLPENLEDVPRD